MFRKGLDWRDVAIKLRYDPFRVRRLWHLYRSGEGSSGISKIEGQGLTQVMTPTP